MSNLPGHEKCKVTVLSWGSHRTLVFGSGKIDMFGRCENPCYECAREYEKQHPEYIGICWPVEQSEKIGEENV
jgi:hypothetical protein